jgi:choline dehydrogenase
MAASGLKPIAGFNSGKLLGYGTATATIDTRYATRDTSESSFLQEAAQKTSIKIYPQAIATKIVFNDQKVATGVEVQSNVVTANLKYLLTARKEVIVSAGVVSVLHFWWDIGPLF